MEISTSPDFDADDQAARKQNKQHSDEAEQAQMDAVFPVASIISR